MPDELQQDFDTEIRALEHADHDLQRCVALREEQGQLCVRRAMDWIKAWYARAKGA